MKCKHINFVNGKKVSSRRVIERGVSQFGNWEKTKCEICGKESKCYPDFLEGIFSIQKNKGGGE